MTLSISFKISFTISLSCPRDYYHSNKSSFLRLYLPIIILRFHFLFTRYNSPISFSICPFFLQILRTTISGGELYQRISAKDNGRLPEEEGKVYFAQIVDAVQHLVGLIIILTMTS